MRLLLVLAALPVVLSGQRKEHPEFVAGDQCLFCHRNDIGPSWGKNAHGVTVRPKEGSTDEFILGSGSIQRALKKTGYGKFAIQDKDGSFNNSKFAERCAGCHTTAVNAQTRTFTEFGIDCYACHGVVSLEHTNDTRLILFSKKNKPQAKDVASICGSCHLRGAASKSTGLPYPANFVPGDDLFADYQADLNKADDAALNPGDRHVWRNLRDILQNNSDVTCLTCHQVHANSTQRHRRVLTSPACLDCHNAEGPKKNIRQYSVHSPLCEY